MYLTPLHCSLSIPYEIDPASIDGETDAFIQEMLRTRFKDTTLVTVAHRLNTIMDYDLILGKTIVDSLIYANVTL